jgi:radical SAM enzyme (TIGR01210 family)
MRGALCLEPAAGEHTMIAEVNSRSAERAAWKAHREALDFWRAQGCFVERERNEHGTVVEVATILLTNRDCPWRCVFCDLWKNTTLQTVPSGAIPAQIDSSLGELHQQGAFNPSAGTGPHGRQIKLYNAGSFFDPKSIPPEDFPAIAHRVRSFDRVIVECHPSLVGESAVRFRERIQPAQFEVAMGLEVADDALLRKLNKRMTTEGFRRAAGFLRAHGIDVRAFIIIKPPFVRDEEEAVRLAGRSIEFAFACGANVAVVIPARHGSAELEALAAAGVFAPPSLSTLEAVLEQGIALGAGRVFADLWDVERLHACPRCVSARIARLRSMSLMQAVPQAIECDACFQRKVEKVSTLHT